jgi:hypothetical protein
MGVTVKSFIIIKINMIKGDGNSPDRNNGIVSCERIDR